MISCGGTTTHSCCPLTRLRSAPWTRRGHCPFCGYRGPPLNPSRLQLPVRLRQGTETVRPGASIPESPAPARLRPLRHKRPPTRRRQLPRRPGPRGRRKGSSPPRLWRAVSRPRGYSQRPFSQAIRWQRRCASSVALNWYSRTPRRELNGEF